jgi:hypothetical protein
MMSIYLAAILGFCALTNQAVATIFPAMLLRPTEGSQLQPQDVPPSGSAQQPPHEVPRPAQEPSQPGSEPGPQPPHSVPPSPTQTKPVPEVPQQPSKAQPATAGKKSKLKSSAAKHRRDKPVAASAPSSPSEKKVIQNGGTADPETQLAPGISDSQANSQRQSTTQLLATTDANLKQISARPLSLSQQDSVNQIRQYVEQAKAAEGAGDVQRAHNLASKAVLLSDDLVKH